MEANAADFVKYTVSDCAESIPFYRDTLGLTLENHVEEYGWAEFAIPPTTLALEQAQPDQDLDPDGSGAAVALAVDDVDAAVEELRADGVSILMDPFDSGVCDIAQISDPDGNPIVLHRRHDGTHGRRDPFPEPDGS